MSARSYLFVPGNRAERFEKAREAGADAVIFDLEDAVQPFEKSAARDTVLRHMDPARPAFVRINAADTSWFADDIAALANHPGVAGIVLPKADTRGQIETVLEHVHASLKILPIVETAFGFANLTQICTAPRVERILFGTLDFQIDLNIGGDGEELTCSAPRSCWRRAWQALPRQSTVFRPCWTTSPLSSSKRGAAAVSGMARSYVFTRSRSPLCIALMHGQARSRHGPHVCCRRWKPAAVQRSRSMERWSICP